MRVVRLILAVGVLACLAPSLDAAQEEITVVDRPAVAPPNDYYAGNRPPLLPSPLIKLPTGSVKPQGWVRRQLELEADGFTGHLTEISRFCRKEDNAWLSPEGKGHSGWEELPYWFRGYCALAYVLGDQRLVSETKPFIEALLASQREDGYFGPRSNLREGKGHLPGATATPACCSPKAKCSEMTRVSTLGFCLFPSRCACQGFRRPTPTCGHRRASPGR